jgi:hypothetical protein
VTGTVTSATRRHGVVSGIIAAVVLAGLGVVLAPPAESATYDEQKRPVIRSMQFSLAAQVLPTASGDATATPTPRVVVIQRTPTPSSATTATAPPNRAALPTSTPSVITIETPSATARTPTATATAAPTLTPPPTATPLPTATPTATPLPTATPSPTPQVAPTLAPAPDVRLQFAAEDWVGGFYRGDSQFYGRPWVAVYGALSDYPRATLGFTLDATPGRAATISITGLDDEWQTLNPIALEVNGQAVYTGPSPFVNWDGVGNGANAAWTTVPFTIPSGLLRAGPNEIAFANLTPAASFNSPPYVLLADAILEISVGATGEATTPTSPTTVPIVPSTSAAAFTAADWIGAFYRGDEQFYGRPWSAIYGAASEYPQATIRFRLDAQPSGPATLTLTGLDDELTELNPIAIEVNGQQVFSGPSPFQNWNGTDDAAWTEVRVTIPADVLKRGRNEITIANLSPSGNFNAPPYVLLADATLEAPGARVTPRS